MPLILCHDCLAWVEAERHLCPDCGGEFEPFQHDPSPEQLEESFGKHVARLGEVRIIRTGRPDWGVLDATTNGLCFLPYIESPTPHVWRAVMAVSRPSKGWKSLTPYFRPATGQKLAVQPTPVAVPVPSSTSDLVAQFMARPGSLFVSADAIRKLEQRGEEISIDRRPMCGLRFQATTDIAGFRTNIQTLLAAYWPHLQR